MICIDCVSNILYDVCPNCGGHLPTSHCRIRTGDSRGSCKYLK
ncbi:MULTISPECIES: DUF1272 domain-containing protein [Olivibacter]|uniref:DUF1272 domain-containing protein n=1 Tax=Olivibacter jilunii TaxID=985016 RepID=A0ABW6B5C5_9SPHI